MNEQKEIFRAASDSYGACGGAFGQWTDHRRKSFAGTGEVRTLKKQEVAQTDEGHQEYYFGLLNEDEQRGYREILEGSEALRINFICLSQEIMR